LNAKHFIDIVASSRLRFLEATFQLNPLKIAEQGFAWFLKESNFWYVALCHGEFKNWKKVQPARMD
jgi:hypothetical protein